MSSLDRRDFLLSSFFAAGAAALSGCVGQNEGDGDGDAKRWTSIPEHMRPNTSIVDTNVYVFPWAFRRFEEASPDVLAAMLRRQGVTEAWTGSFEGVFHKNIGTVNEQLARACDQHEMFVPFGTVQPMFPDWEEDLRRCDEEYNMPGIRLHPGYHHYTLDDPVFVRLLNMAAERGMIVQIVPWLRDRRHHNPIMRIPSVDLSPLAGVLDAVPDVPIVIQNALRSGGDGVVDTFAAYENVRFDFSRMDHFEGLATLLERIPERRVVFGSYSPMIHFEAPLLQMYESQLTDQQIESVCRTSATDLLGRT